MVYTGTNNGVCSSFSTLRLGRWGLSFNISEREEGWRRGGGRGGDEELTWAQAVSGHSVMEAHKHIKLSMKYRTSHCTMTQCCSSQARIPPPDLQVYSPRITRDLIETIISEGLEAVLFYFCC